MVFYLSGGCSSNNSFKTYRSLSKLINDKYLSYFLEFGGFRSDCDNRKKNKKKAIFDLHFIVISCILIGKIIWGVDRPLEDSYWSFFFFCLTDFLEALIFFNRLFK